MVMVKKITQKTAKKKKEPQKKIKIKKDQLIKKASKKPKTTIKKKEKKVKEKVVKIKESKEVKETKKTKPSKEKKPKISKADHYWEAVGRRKTATAQVRLWARGEKEFLVNDKPYQEYFLSLKLQQVARASLEKMKTSDRFKVSAKVKGGGLSGQAEAVRHGIARALVKFNSSFQKRLKKAGFLTRDPRMRERKKFGLKRARRAPQWRKR